MTNQIDAHKAESERRERRKKSEVRAAQDEDMEGVVVEEADSTEEVGVQVEAGKTRKVAKRGRFGTGSASAGRIDIDRVIRELQSLSEQERERCMRSMGNFPGPLVLPQS